MAALGANLCGVNSFAKHSIRQQPHRGSLSSGLRPGAGDLRERKLAPPLLDVRIASVKIPVRRGYGNAIAELRAVLGAKEVKEAVAALDLHEAPPELGMANGPKGGVATDTATILRGVTARDVLNCIAQQFGAWRVGV